VIVKRLTRSNRPVDAIELVLALTQARIIGEATLKDAPEYLRGYEVGIRVAIELIRASDGMLKAVDDREYEKR
jgi:hypothetical protein